MEDQKQQQQKSIRDILYIIFKYKWLIVTFFLIVIITTMMVLLLVPPEYESNAKVIVSSGGTDTLEMVTGMSRQSEIHAELELLQSRGFTETVVDKIGYEAILFKVEREDKGINKLINFIAGLKKTKLDETEMDIREDAIELFSESLSLSIVPRSDVINLSYFAPTPELAQNILNETIETYMDKHIEIHTTAISLEFLSDEVERLESELRLQQEKLRQFQRNVDIVSFTEQQTLFLESITELEAVLQQTEADIYASEASIENMKPMIEMREVLREEEVRLDSLRARYNIVRRQLRNKRAELAELRQNERRYLELTSQIDILAENYNRYLSSLEQARIAQTLENQRISSISIMQRPTLIIEPISQDKMKKLILGLFVGIIGGFGLAFIIEYMSHKIKTVEDVRSVLKIQNIIAIPPVNVRKLSQFIMKRALQERKELFLPAKVMSKNVTVWLYMIPEIRECFESIKSHLYGEMGKVEGDRPKNAPYVLGVTSAYRGEGVSSIALGVAYTISLAEGENVLLVDSNLHNPHEEKIIGENRPPGLYELTAGLDGLKTGNNEKENKTDDSFFSLKNMNEHLSQGDGSNKIDKLLPSVVKLNYKLIILDLPSISEGVAALKSSAIADGILYVIESEKVRREVMKHTKEKLENAGAKIFSVVLNKRRLYIPTWLYHRL
jgi:uncharacterized protein involved in exopolysaccharide biosynthesis/Mrp family chromosome partitioning ATPase